MKYTNKAIQLSTIEHNRNSKKKRPSNLKTEQSPNANQNNMNGSKHISSRDNDSISFNRQNTNSSLLNIL